MGGAAVTSVSAQPSDAVAFLEQEKGLSRHAGGPVWLSKTERCVRAHLPTLDPLRAAIVTQQNAIQELILSNAARWQASREQIMNLQQMRKALKPGDAKQKQIDLQIEELRKKAVEPARLGADPDVRRRLIELLNLRHKLTLAVVEIRTLVPRLEAEYQQLAQDPDVTAAFQRIVGAYRLGPLNVNYPAYVQRLGDYERVVLTPWTPLYLQSDCPRVTGLLNERVPFTFSWQAGSEPTIVTAGMIEAAGLKIPSDAPTIQQTLGRNRKLSVREITLPSVRFGKYVLRELPAYVLPPEGEDLGAQISPRAFALHRAVADLEGLRFTLEPR
jgi:hypothetical protein